MKRWGVLEKQPLQFRNVLRRTIILIGNFSPSFGAQLGTQAALTLDALRPERQRGAAAAQDTRSSKSVSAAAATAAGHGSGPHSHSAKLQLKTAAAAGWSRAAAAAPPMDVWSSAPTQACSSRTSKTGQGFSRKTEALQSHHYGKLL